ncbi:MAG: hypothetical protein ACREHG_04210 [Candidatus Saccharimonadales bacterium]
MSYPIVTPSGRCVQARRVTEVIRWALPAPELHAWELREAVAHALTGSERTPAAALVSKSML